MSELSLDPQKNTNLNNLPAFSPCDCMQIGVEAVVKVGVRLPDFLQHLHVEAQLVDHQVVRVLLQPLQVIIKVFVQTQLFLLQSLQEIIKEFVQTQ